MVYRNAYNVHDLKASLHQYYFFQLKLNRYLAILGSRLLSRQILWERYSTYLLKCRAVCLNSETIYIFIEIVELYKNTTEHNVTASLLKNELSKYRLLGPPAFMDKLKFKTQFSLPQGDIS